MERQSIQIAAADAPQAAKPSPLAASAPAVHALTVCLAGVPNAGKTALMNGLTGGGFHTANYPGATVTLSRGKSRADLGPQVTTPIRVDGGAGSDKLLFEGQDVPVVTVPGGAFLALLFQPLSYRNTEGLRVQGSAVHDGEQA